MDMNQAGCSYMTTGRKCCDAPPQPCPPPIPPMPPAPPCPAQQPLCACVQERDCGCACASGMAAALELLCDARIAELVDFSQFAFVTDGFVLGSSLSCPDTSTAAYDNLTGPLAGVFEQITPSTCDNLEVSGQIYYPVSVCSDTTCCANGPAFEASEVALCAIRAVAFSASTAEASETAESNARLLRRYLWQALHCSPCPPETLPTKATPCDSSGGSIGRRRTLSVTAGPLLVANAAVLGMVGDVIVLANDTDSRFYFICNDAVDFIG